MEHISHSCVHSISPLPRVDCLWQMAIFHPQRAYWMGDLCEGGHGGLSIHPSICTRLVQPSTPKTGVCPRIHWGSLMALAEGKSELASLVMVPGNWMGIASTGHRAWVFVRQHSRLPTLQRPLPFVISLLTFRCEHSQSVLVQLLKCILRCKEAFCNWMQDFWLDNYQYPR